MLIADLDYSEDVLETHSISGSAASVGVSAYASATGDSTYTLTGTDTTARALGNGGSIAKGRGIAVAIGDSLAAGVITSGTGDKVIQKTKEHYFKNKDMLVVRGFVIAIDHP